MKKVFRNLFAAIAAVSLVSSFASCSDGSDGDDENTSKMTEGIAVTGNEITFNVTADSTNKDDTVLFVKYDRSAKGAKELITIADAEFKISVNGTVTNTVKKITFELDEYGASFSRAATPIADKDDMKEYKTKIPVGVQVKKSDVVKVQLVKGTVTGEGKNAVDLSAIVVALIDKAEKVSYYKELCENSSEYQALVKIEKTEEQLKAEAAKKAEEDAKKAEEAKKAAEEAAKKAEEAKNAEEAKKAAEANAGTENTTGNTGSTGNTGNTTENTGSAGTGNTGAGETPAATVVKTIELVQNCYKEEGAAEETNHGLFIRKTVSEMGIDLGTPANGDVYTIKMKGTATDYSHLSNMCIGFETDYDWSNCAMEGGKDFSEAKLTAGVSVDVTFNGTASGDWYFWFYDGGTDATAGATTLKLTEFSVTKKSSGSASTGASETPAATTTNYKAYTLTTSKAAKKDDVGLTFQYFAGDSEEPATITLTNLKVSVKIGDADAVEKTFDSVTIEHHTWDANAKESNARVNLGLGSATEEIASGTTVVLKVLSATVSDTSKASSINFALQQDGKYNSWEMLTAADSKAFVTE